MFVNFKPALSKRYQREKLLVYSTLATILNNNVINIIFDFLRRPESGYRLFKNIKYKINDNLYYYNINGHPLEVIIRLIVELNIPLNYGMLSSYKSINISDMLNFFDEIRTNDSDTKISLTKFLTQIHKLNLMDENITNPSDFCDLFSQFCKNVLNLGNIKIDKIETRCKICNFYRHKYFNINTSQCIFSYGELISETVRINHKNIIKLCHNCNKLTIVNKKILRSYCVNYWLLSTSNYLFPNIFKPLKTIQLTNSKMYELKAMITYEPIESIGKYDVIIKRIDGWYYFSKLYIKKMTFEEVLEIKPIIKYLLYELVN